MNSSSKLSLPSGQTAASRDRYLLVPKALYFLCSCFMYAPALFQAKYLRDVWGISAKDYGYLNLVTIFSIFASLIWSGLADRFHAHKRILMIKSLCYGLSYCALWFFEPFMINWSKSVKVAVILSLFFTTTIFCSAIFPLLGTLVFSILEGSESLRNGPIPPKRLLGRQKLFGTIGIGLVFAFNGTLTDFIGYRAQFLIVSSTCIAFSAIAFFGLSNNLATVSTSVKEVDYKSSESPILKSPPKQSWRKNVVALLSNMDFLLLLVIVFLIGLVGSVFNVYFSIFMGFILQNSSRKNGIMGYMTAIRLLVEIPIYIWGDKLIGTFGSHGVLLMGMAASAVRPFGYALLVSDESKAFYGFIFELFKGISHACNGLGGCVLASDMAPAGAQGTAQALFTSAHHHAASVISGLLCSIYLGFMKENEASIPQKIIIYRELFFITGIIGLLGSFLNVYRLFAYRRKHHS